MALKVFDMVYTVVINEVLWVREFDSRTEGTPYGKVINGQWELVLSSDLKEYWPKIYPEARVKVHTIREAVPGECKPYY